ncbi:MAG TPA: hypothetical protein VNJ28_03885 [Candidatus Limnocylindrales bacterium]|nr:hypothetical protein [Candidatus Limnocylindrales bacterium]
MADRAVAVLARRLERGGPTSLERLLGLGSVFGKGLRDSRRAVLLVGVGLPLLILLTASQLAIQFPTAADRLQLAAQSSQLPPVLRGLLGDPIAIDRLGGFVSWRLGNFLPVIVGLWSILALSGTIAGEARGGLELVVAAPLPRRRIALEKVAAHVVGLGLAMLGTALGTWLAGVLFGVLPGDGVELGAAVSHFAGVAIVSLVPGAIAFAAGPFLGRAAAAGLGAIVLFAAYLVASYASVFAAFEPLAGLSWFEWTSRHRPLAGVSDPVPVGVVAGLAAALLGAGVVAFERRDLGATVRLPGLPLPGRRLSLRDPFLRSLGARSGAAVAWGAGIAVYGWMIALSARQFAQQFATIPGIERLLEQFYPGLDWRSAGGVLQLAFFEFGTLLLALAAATLVAGWTSDERDGRLELVLAAPIGRFRWATTSGLGTLAALAVLVGLAALGIALGAALDGSDPIRPFAGVWVGGLYAAALAGVGIALSGAIGPGLGGPVVGGIGLGLYLFDTIGRALRLPAGLLDLSLTRHLGQPMIGRFDEVGLAVCLALAAGGLLVGAAGLARRDLRA